MKFHVIYDSDNQLALFRHREIPLTISARCFLDEHLSVLEKDKIEVVTARPKDSSGWVRMRSSGAVRKYMYTTYTAAGYHMWVCLPQLRRLFGRVPPTLYVRKCT